MEEIKGELDKSPVVSEEFMILLSIAGRLWMTKKGGDRVT